LAAPTVILDETRRQPVVDHPQPYTTPASPRRKRNVQRGPQSLRTPIPELQDPAIVEEYRRRLEETSTAQFLCTHLVHSVESNPFLDPSSLPVTEPVIPREDPMAQNVDEEQLQVIINAMVQNELKNAGKTHTSSTMGINLGQPEAFNGTPHKLDGFLQECKLHFIVKPEVFETEDHKVGFILSYMKTGDTKRWKEQYLKSRDAAVDAAHLYSLVPNRRFADFEIEL
jgi:hypothetical protein